MYQQFLIHVPAPEDSARIMEQLVQSRYPKGDAMKSALIAACSLVIPLMAGCGGASTLTPESALERLVKAGVSCSDASVQPLTLMCNLEQGDYAESSFSVVFDRDVTAVCADILTDDPILNKATAQGANWVIASGNLLEFRTTILTTVNMRSLADALGGEVMTVRTLCDK